MANNYAVELKEIRKSFGKVIANNNVGLNLKQGEILALLGENGSGKTTLMNILSGMYKPDSGHIYINGKEVSIHSPEDSKRLGIGMVHQHFKLVNVFSATDNIWMGTTVPKYGLKEKLKKLNYTKSENEPDKKADFKKAFSSVKEVFKCGWHYLSNFFLSHSRYNYIKEIADKFGFNIYPKKKVSEMSVSEKQTIEIIKVLYYGAKIIVLDEPTAVLTVQEIEKLFNVLRKMKEEGHAIIIITHKLNEVLDISDRVTIMRKGEYIATVETKDTTIQELTDLMVGKKIDLNIERPINHHNGPLLEIRNLTIKNDEGATAIDDVNFYIRGGEIMGVAGISGCGQKELCEAIAGLRKIQSGKIIHKGDNVVGLSPKKIIEKGIAMSFIPEDRLNMGLAPSLSITDNMMLKTYKGKWYNPFVNRKSARAKANEIIENLSIVTPGTETPVRKLSGGNVQKVLVGREIQAGPNVIIIAYPVRGLDINSSYAIYDILNKQKKNGVGILYVGEDLDVLMALCDKIMVLCHGKVMGVVHADKVTKEELGLMMTGSLNLTKEKIDKHIGIAKDSKIKETEEDDD